MKKLSRRRVITIILFLLVASLLFIYRQGLPYVYSGLKIWIFDDLLVRKVSGELAKGTIEIAVVDKNGEPVNAEIKFEQISHDFMFGVFGGSKNLDDLKGMGVEWTRRGIHSPQASECKEIEGKVILPEDAYQTIEEYYLWAKEAAEHNIHPIITTWYKDKGDKGKNVYLVYKNFCRELEKKMGKLPHIYQIENELNIERFNQGAPEEHMILLMKSCAEGIVEENPEAILGTNVALGEPGWLEWLKRVYTAIPEFYYVGLDAYFGTWSPGKPYSWDRELRIVYNNFKKPIFINEFGYSSGFETIRWWWGLDWLKLLKETGGLFDPQNFFYKSKHWLCKWGSGHNEETQAKYLTEAFKTIFRNKNVIGAAWFCYHDYRHDVVLESKWGLVDVDGRKKEGYFAYKKLISDSTSRGVRKGDKLKLSVYKGEYEITAKVNGKTYKTSCHTGEKKKIVADKAL